MQNDEIRQALDWTSRLARYTWQIKDGRVSLDTPAKHIFVKDAQQVIAMFKRRGYSGMKEEIDDQGWLCWIDSEYVGRCYVRESFYLYETVAAVSEKIDKWFGNGWKHMQCIQCGTPLLASFKWVDEPGVALKWYGVCSVQAGPYTNPLEVCPGCGIEFTGEREYPPPLRGIDDVSEEEKRSVI